MDVRGVGADNLPDEQDIQVAPEASNRPSRRTIILGWIALGISVVIAGFWAFWGTLEAFHEGWWDPTLSGRLVQTAMYHIPLAITLVMCLLAIRWPKIGAMVYFVLGGAFTFWIFKERWGNLTLYVVLSWVPTTLMFCAVGLLWWFGKPWPRRWAYIMTIALPLIISLACAVEPIWRISHRDFTPRLTEVTLPGNGVELTWAPPGPGWVRDAKHSCDWYKANEICEHLSEDGTEIMEEPQGYWRLPTAGEISASMTRGGKNAGGVWDNETSKGEYEMKPDKEPPLWDPIAETIYWWTATEDGPDKAHFMVYHGGTFATKKTSRMGSRGFRAVRCEQQQELVEEEAGAADVEEQTAE